MNGTTTLDREFVPAPRAQCECCARRLMQSLYTCGGCGWHVCSDCGIRVERNTRTLCLTCHARRRP